MIKCLIFDCDGTLVDSELLCNVGLVIKLRQIGIHANATELMLQYRGWKLAKIMESLEDHYHIELAPNFEPSYRKIVKDLFESGLKPVEGVHTLLEQVELPMCVASSGPRHKIEQALRVTGLAPFFGRNLFSSYEVQSWKPEPGLFLHAAEQMGFAPEHCAVIEDSEVGIQAAQAAGMWPIHYDPSGQFNSVGSAFKIAKMAELSELITLLAQ